jgi:hypothetical protein
VRTILRNGLDRYEVLKADEPLRRGERLVRFAGERGALDFLVQAGGPARRDLHRLAGSDFMGEFTGVTQDGIPTELARRVYAGRLKLVMVETAPIILRMGGANLVVLHGGDRLRRDESWMRIIVDGSAARISEALKMLPESQWRRLPTRASVEVPSSRSMQNRHIKDLLYCGDIRIASLRTLVHSSGTNGRYEPAQIQAPVTSMDAGSRMNVAGAAVSAPNPAYIQGSPIRTALGQRVVQFITKEMKDHARSFVVKQMKWTTKANLGIPPLPVLLEFLALERSGGPWDQKRQIGKMLNAEWSVLPGDLDHKYYYDIWSNIHYGYIGRASGIPAGILQQAHQVPFEPLFGRSDEGDVLTVQIGIDLWEKYGDNVTEKEILGAVLSKRPDLIRTGKAMLAFDSALPIG